MVNYLIITSKQSAPEVSAWGIKDCIFLVVTREGCSKLSLKDLDNQLTRVDQSIVVFNVNALNNPDAHKRAASFISGVITDMSEWRLWAHIGDNPTQARWKDFWKSNYFKEYAPLLSNLERNSYSWSGANKNTASEKIKEVAQHVMRETWPEAFHVLEDAWTVASPRRQSAANDGLVTGLCSVNLLVTGDLRPALAHAQRALGNQACEELKALADAADRFVKWYRHSRHTDIMRFRRDAGQAHWDVAAHHFEQLGGR